MANSFYFPTAANRSRGFYSLCETIIWTSLFILFFLNTFLGQNAFFFVFASLVQFLEADVVGVLPGSKTKVIKGSSKGH